MELTGPPKERMLLCSRPFLPSRTGEGGSLLLPPWMGIFLWSLVVESWELWLLCGSRMLGGNHGEPEGNEGGTLPMVKTAVDRARS